MVGTGKAPGWNEQLKQFTRRVGYRLVSDHVQNAKFLLGRDLNEAILRQAKLEQLWEQVKREWRTDREHPDLGAGVKPTWNEETLVMAKAIAKGQSLAYLRAPAELDLEPADKLEWLADRQERFPAIGVTFDSLNEKRQALAAAKGQQQAFRHLPQVFATTHEAIDTYIAYIPSEHSTPDGRLKGHGRTLQANFRFIRRHCPCLELASFGLNAINGVILKLSKRPSTVKGTPCSPSMARATIKDFRRFLDWLHTNEEFPWKLPTDYRAKPMRIDLTEEEAERDGVEVFTVEQLATLWKAATPYQRLIMSLGLNTGASSKELVTLDLVRHFDGDKISQKRSKTGVKGHFSLWALTADCLTWWKGQRPASGSSAVFVDKDGVPLKDKVSSKTSSNGALAAEWSKLVRKVQQTQPDFPGLSIKYLRKTGGQLVQDVSTEETAISFTRHGNPSDPLLRDYTNPTWSRVTEALAKVEAKLQQAFN